MVIALASGCKLQEDSFLTVRAHLLALRYLAHEVCFPLFQIRWESFLERLFHSTFDLFLLLFTLYLCFLLCYSGLPFRFSLQGFSEPRICSSLVIEVDCVGYSTRSVLRTGVLRGLRIRNRLRRC